MSEVPKLAKDQIPFWNTEKFQEKILNMKRMPSGACVRVYARTSTWHGQEGIHSSSHTFTPPYDLCRLWTRTASETPTLEEMSFKDPSCCVTL